MDNFYCTENQKISLKGSWGDSYISYLVAKISVCKNETENGTCASPEEIKEFIKKDIYYWNIYYQNTNINPKIQLNKSEHIMIHSQDNSIEFKPSRKSLVHFIDK